MEHKVVKENKKIDVSKIKLDSVPLANSAKSLDRVVSGQCSGLLNALDKTNNSSLSKFARGLSNMRTGVSGVNINDKLNNSSFSKIAQGLSNVNKTHSGLVNSALSKLFSPDLMKQIHTNMENNNKLIHSAASVARVQEPNKKLSETIIKYEQKKNEKEQEKIDTLKELCNSTDKLILQMAENQNLTTNLLINSQQTNVNTATIAEEAQKTSLENKKSVKTNIRYTVITIICTLFIGAVQIYNDNRIQKLQDSYEREVQIYKEQIDKLHIDKIVSLENTVKQMTEETIQQQAMLIELQKKFLSKIDKLNENISLSSSVATKTDKTKTEK